MQTLKELIAILIAINIILLGTYIGLYFIGLEGAWLLMFIVMSAITALTTYLIFSPIRRIVIYDNNQ